MEAATTTTIDPEHEYECTFPGCAKRYARKDAVKKHAKEKHPNWEMLCDSRKRGSQLAFCRQVACVCPSVQRVEAVEQPDAKKQKVAESVASTNSSKEAGNESASEEDEPPPRPALIQSDIEAWTARDVQHSMIRNRALPADVVSCTWPGWWDPNKSERLQTSDFRFC